MNLTFQRRTDLALSALRQLAEIDGSVPGPELAETLGTTIGFLPQVMSPLVKAGWVDSGRGPGGGYRLTPLAKNASILDVVERTEGRPDEGGCVLRDALCPGYQACMMHSVWTEVRDVLTEGLRGLPAISTRGGTP